MGFKPSRAAEVSQYFDLNDAIEADTGPANLRSSPTGTRNALYQTEAEEVQSVTPFMRANIARDSDRRNYRILPGGRVAYHKEALKYMDNLSPENVQLGHESQPGVGLGDSGRRFTVGERE